MSSTLDHLACKRRKLAADYAALRKAHAPSMAVGQQLMLATSRVLEVQVAEDRRAKERARKMARAGQQPSLLADLDLLCN